MSDTLRDYVDMATFDETPLENHPETDCLSPKDDDVSLISIEDADENLLWSLVTSSAINMILPFINGMMLGFGEIAAHEIGFRYGWYGAKVEPPLRMDQVRAVGEGVRAVVQEKSAWI